MTTMNRLATAQNPYQGNFKRVLCVCSAGLLRSPTTAWVLANEFDCNTRAAGLAEDYALVPVDTVLLFWADEIVCMDREQKKTVEEMLGGRKTPVHSLDIPDNFQYRDPALVELIRSAYSAVVAAATEEAHAARR